MTTAWAISGPNKTSYLNREPIENDEEKLAMKRSEMPPSSIALACGQFEN